MSTNEPQVNTVVEPSSTQTPVVLENNKKYTILLNDIQRFVKPINQLLKPEKQLKNVASLNDLTRALAKENLRLKDKVIELNPSASGTNSTSINFNNEIDKDNYLGFNSITVKTKPLENIIIPMLTPSMLTQSSGSYIIEKTSDSFCGINQIEIQDIALASNIEYTITTADLSTKRNGNYIVNFDFTGNSAFNNFSDDIKNQYIDENGNCTVFGAKDLTVSVPLVESHEFVVDTTTLDKTFLPADIPANFDGTGGVAGKIGFKNIILRATKKMNITKDTVLTAIASGNAPTWSTGTENTETPDGVAGVGIGYPSIEIPPISTANLYINYSNYSDILYDNTILSFDGSYYHNLQQYISDTHPCAIDSFTLSRGFEIGDIIESSNLFSDYNINTIYNGNGSALSIDLFPYPAYNWSGDYISSNSNLYQTNSSFISDYLTLTRNTYLEIPCPCIVNLPVDYTKFIVWRNQKETPDNYKLSDYISEEYPALTDKATIGNISLKLSDLITVSSVGDLIFYESSMYGLQKKTMLISDSTKYNLEVHSDDGTVKAISAIPSPFENFNIIFENKCDDICRFAVCTDIDTLKILSAGKKQNLPLILLDYKQQSFFAQLALISDLELSSGIDNKKSLFKNNLLFCFEDDKDDLSVFFGVETSGTFGEKTISWTTISTEANNSGIPFMLTESSLKSVYIASSITLNNNTPYFFKVTDRVG